MISILILGVGKVGSAIAIDLSENENFEITIADNNIKNIKHVQERVKLNYILTDFSQISDLSKLVKKYDIIVSAVPGFMGYQTLKTIIENKKDVVDISFFPENPLELDVLAKKNGITAIVDIGVAPGLGNILFGYHDQHMKIDSYKCYVGGLPKNKIKPFEYKAPFSPIDVIEEYTRPARLFKNSKVVTVEPLTDLEILSFDTNENLEAFNTDGLRTLLQTMSHVPDMIEKTLRYPGHAEKILILKKMGLFSEGIKKLKNISYRPIDIASQLLQEQWNLEKNEEEFTVMRIIIENNFKKINIDLYDEFCKKTKISSMARTTGYTCTSAVNLLADGLFNHKGVYPPELIGKDSRCFKFIIKYLRERGINLRTTVV